MQSTCEQKDPPELESSKLHVAVIMDGNGRWAKARRLPRSAGHYAGVAALREVVHAAPELGVSTLTVFGFSVDNWQRPAAEVSVLMALIQRFLEQELAALVQAGVRLTAIGRRDRFPNGLSPAIAHAETITAGGGRLNLRLAIDYSSRDTILRAVRACREVPLTRNSLSTALDGPCSCGDVDLLIRTSGERRLSDFLLWEAAYAELYFTETLWPDFGAPELAAAMADFRRRDRRFGALSMPLQPDSTGLNQECGPP